MRITTRHSFVITPKYANKGDAGLDIFADPAATHYISPGETKLIPTGLSFEIPEGYVGLLAERSSLHKRNLELANGVGIIDSSYRGELYLPLRNKRFSILARILEFLLRPFTTKEELALIKEEHFPGRVVINPYGNNEVALCQLLILPYERVDIEIVDELSQTERGSGGFGSTDKKG